MATSWWDSAVDLVLPRCCPGCGGPTPWCSRCAGTLGLPRRVQLSATAQDRAPGPVPPVRALARWAGPAREAILAGKERGRRDLPPRLGLAFAAGIAQLLRWEDPPGPVWLVPAPGRRSAARRRGGDPVTVMAIAAATALADLGQPVGVAAALRTVRTAQDSVGLSNDERWRNLAGRIRPGPRDVLPRGAAVVLLDDVVTSGATLLLSADVIARTWPTATVWSALTIATAAPWVTTRGQERG